jgi:hypothetical protein
MVRLLSRTLLPAYPNHQVSPRTHRDCLNGCEGKNGNRQGWASAVRHNLGWAIQFHQAAAMIPIRSFLSTNRHVTHAMNASLAVSDGEIFLRTDRHLWCIDDTGKR